MSVGILGAGAFGTALAISLGHTTPVTLWARDAKQAQVMQNTRENTARLPGFALPAGVKVTSNLADLQGCDVLLLAVPAQKLRQFLRGLDQMVAGKTLVTCCKGIELETGMGPVDIAREICPQSEHAILTGPSFANDIAKGLPTALTLACANPDRARQLQQELSNGTLRLYRTSDVIGAQLGGALKNVIAIACGAAIGAQLGESARAALMTRGNAEMQRYAQHKGADASTLSGLSGFGDLVLTCTSELSRNYRFGLALGAGKAFDPATTVEGAATACAVAQEAREKALDMPISSVVAALVENRLDVENAMTKLLSRSLKEE
ncbi:glycerol-3-phosphate dehydrogenase (NAD(P)(+)) [Roseobacter denitrificans]|uniref:Glycerol-3-phosphate dehydrogenase [NAD(P)+] n=1 Tax=Roseobacter denitrificans (strain ATCC 33942 / OCh 114) TaxID=375451 RepID=GPDA_ROSDO|nr:NAD(P)H-dependent glycerol-3-phosphate dehydrogenase [Roseobacter denitrificans]Q16CW4.1 RecName: Full=Glycerol-3-phosphate dehydrogenase [NAD(P)+]; AltName: Full=NAD(P)H-dependent glycerol-3-phosphate dehydrogenase [Roseobacter denitrificans OCh 114]ABG30179.1 glycerol-3-phosphate dehydrogenase, putative [Roseobacter denitrificans OCh 114]AVL53369.1 glycerol-3-phosphate dehydrogenase (NAD(P)(+)) [Roseobacter denitrificans]SFF70342.1 glycerol-3-phosphate dehydrogenase (NAD(P)+) [Roseobacter 